MALSQGFYSDLFQRIFFQCVCMYVDSSSETHFHCSIAEERTSNRRPLDSRSPLTITRRPLLYPSSSAPHMVLAETCERKLVSGTSERMEARGEGRWQCWDRQGPGARLMVRGGTGHWTSRVFGLVTNRCETNENLMSNQCCDVKLMSNMCQMDVNSMSDSMLRISIGNFGPHRGVGCRVFAAQRRFLSPPSLTNIPPSLPLVSN